MAVIYDIVIVAGTYQKDGQEKKRYQTIGRVIETDKGKSIKIDSIPVVEGGWNGWASLFEPRTGEQKPAPNNTQKPDFMDDNIDF